MRSHLGVHNSCRITGHPRKEELDGTEPVGDLVWHPFVHGGGSGWTPSVPTWPATFSHGYLSMLMDFFERLSVSTLAKWKITTYKPSCCLLVLRIHQDCDLSVIFGGMHGNKIEFNNIPTLQSLFLKSKHIPDSILHLLLCFLNTLSTKRQNYPVPVTFLELWVLCVIELALKLKPIINKLSDYIHTGLTSNMLCSERLHLCQRKMLAMM